MPRFRRVLKNVMAPGDAILNPTRFFQLSNEVRAFHGVYNTYCLARQSTLYPPLLSGFHSRRKVKCRGPLTSSRTIRTVVKAVVDILEQRGFEFGVVHGTDDSAGRLWIAWCISRTVVGNP